MNPWIKHVKDFASKHKITYREAMSKAKSTYKTQKGSGHMGSKISDEKTAKLERELSDAKQNLKNLKKLHLIAKFPKVLAEARLKKLPKPLTYNQLLDIEAQYELSKTTLQKNIIDLQDKIEAIKSGTEYKVRRDTLDIKSPK